MKYMRRRRYCVYGEIMLMKIHARACQTTQTHITYYPESFAPREWCFSLWAIKNIINEKKGRNISILRDAVVPYIQCRYLYSKINLFEFVLYN